MKFEKKETLSRKDAADRLAKIAAAMSAAPEKPTARKSAKRRAPAR